MFSALISKMHRTIKYTICILAAISFFTMVFYSVFVIYTDYNTKTSQLAVQYSECFDIQLNSSTKPTMLIKNPLQAAVTENNVSQFDTFTRIVRMAHPAINTFELHTGKPNSVTPGYKLTDGLILQYTVPYISDETHCVYGILEINLLSILNSLNLDSHIFLKGADVYISQDDISYYQIVGKFPNAPNYATPVSKSNIENRKSATAHHTQIAGGTLYLYTVPRTSFIPRVTIFILISLAVLIFLLLLAFRLIRIYTAHTEKLLNRLVNDMDKFIQSKEDDYHA